MKHGSDRSGRSTVMHNLCGRRGRRSEERDRRKGEIKRGETRRDRERGREREREREIERE